MMKTSKNKVMIIGVDGGTYRFINPMIKEGKLPNFKRLINNGVACDLISTIPSVTPTAFTTFMTGVNPGQHGIFDFAGGIHHDYRKRTILNSSNISVKTIWEIASENNKKVISIGVPFTYPPLPVNGIMVSHGKPNPDGVKDIKTYPPEIGKEILENIGGIQQENLDRRDKKFGKMSDSDFYQDLIEKVHYVFDKTRMAALYLMKKYEWDIFMVHIILTDTFQHFFWRFIDPGHVSYDKALAVKFGNAISKAYEDVDKMLGEILDLKDDNTTVMIMSDHGFGPVHYYFNMNYWLEEIGLLKRKKSIVNHYSARTTTIRRGLTKIGCRNIADKLPGWMAEMRLPIVKHAIDLGGAYAFRYHAGRFADRIDWTQTKAYADIHGINLNLKGREPEGIVSPGKEQEEVIQYITEKLLSLKGPINNDTIVGEVLKKEDVFRGHCTKEATDLYFFFKEGQYYYLSPDASGNEIFTKLNGNIPLSGHHVSHRSTQRGIFIANGPEINNKTGLGETRMMDIAPTILYLLGLPLPAKMEGTIIKELIDKSFLDSNSEIRTEDADGFHVAREKISLSEKEEDEIKEQLKGLGYL